MSDFLFMDKRRQYVVFQLESSILEENVWLFVYGETQTVDNMVCFN